MNLSHKSEKYHIEVGDKNEKENFTIKYSHYLRIYCQRNRLLYGILSLFHNLATSILLAIILLVGIVCILITFWRKREAEDEMAKYNLAKAHRLALSKVLQQWQ